MQRTSNAARTLSTDSLRRLKVSLLPGALAARCGPVHSATPDPGRRNAAVALILRFSANANHDPSVLDCDFLAIRRAVSRRDPWSGQMALPGGRLEEDDAGLAAAAIRETREETGVRLSAGALLGRLEPLRPLMSRAPAVTVWPFVFRAPPGLTARPASPEVASVHWLRMSAFADPASRGVYTWVRDGGRRRFPCSRIDGHVIWGLTFRVLEQICEI